MHELAVNIASFIVLLACTVINATAGRKGLTVFCLFGTIFALGMIFVNAYRVAA
jgi:hypothetical protein